MRNQCGHLVHEAARASRLALACVALAGFGSAAVLAQDGPGDEEWRALFDGASLDGWVVKIRGHDLDDNFADTFRVEDGLLTVAYDGYTDFASRFGHLFYSVPYSHYRLRIEYRFIGEQAPNAPDWARRNSGVMLHSQPPESMTREQDFPISVEVQFLGGLREGEPRPTANVCTPGTHIVYNGRLDETHCINSTSPTLHGDQWVTAEVLVHGDERIVHYVNGDAVLEYGGTVYGGGVVSNHRPEMKPDGEPLTSGYIALQSEGHPIQFRRVELLDLTGCMDRQARNYKVYHVESDPQACEYEAPAMQTQPPNTLTDEERLAGWTLLFDGRSLAGWRGYNGEGPPPGWAVEDGALARVGSGGDIVTETLYGDFELALEWQVGPGGNSGVFYRAEEGEPLIYHSAPEMQVLDDAGHPDGGDPLTSAGANYGLHPAPRGVVKPAGEWNQARIRAVGNHIEHWLNGVKVVEYEVHSEDWRRRVAASKFGDWPAYGRAIRGHIGLQDHGDPVWFRNIKIRAIGP